MQQLTQPTDPGDHPAEIVSYTAPVNLRRLTRYLTCRGMIERIKSAGGRDPYWRHVIPPADPHDGVVDEATR